MVLTLFVLANFWLAALFFLNRRKHLHPLDIIFCWIVGTLLVQNYSALNTMNFRYFVIPDRLDLELAHFLNRIVLVPIIFIWFLNGWVGAASLRGKIAAAAGAVAVLFGVESGMVLSGVLSYNGWKPWWSMAVWTGAVVVATAAMKGFRSIRMKKGRQV